MDDRTITFLSSTAWPGCPSLKVGVETCKLIYFGALPS